ncbi:unnamed protein product [Heterotrigona itama]|uniref:CUB domain-containing protein n=1 Tax=Heterotrigona itama TaxID=395501 RepID=A0A6V7H7Y0_9HYME|nr:unnamed protein product [Heterotrigona itama]
MLHLKRPYFLLEKQQWELLIFEGHSGRITICSDEELELFETSGVSEYTPWSGVLCGDIHDIPQVLYSSRSTLILELHTQGTSSNATGFFGNFHFINRRELLNLFA